MPHKMECFIDLKSAIQQMAYYKTQKNNSKVNKYTNIKRFKNFKSIPIRCADNIEFQF